MVGMFKSRMMRWVDNAADMREMKYAYKGFN
jgi:hypothetical protein